MPPRPRAAITARSTRHASALDFSSASSTSTGLVSATVPIRPWHPCARSLRGQDQRRDLQELKPMLKPHL